MQLKAIKLELSDKFEWANWLKNVFRKKSDEENADHEIYKQGRELIEENLNLMKIL